LQEIKLEIEELIHNNAPDFEIAKVIKNNINNYYATLPEIFKESGGKDFLIKHTRKIDSVIKLVYKIATREMFQEYFVTKSAIPLVITALGSYGREQLSPKSDIDIMFVYKDIPGYNIKALIEKMFYLLLDSGLKLGHRVHEISELEEVAKSDITIKSAILEARFIDGTKYLWFEVQNAIEHIRLYKQEEFILAKIQERRELRAKYPLMMEPNLKEGVGGFRDANVVYWIGKLLYNVPTIRDLPRDIVDERDYAEFRSALEFLFRVRSALHLVVKKKSDQMRLEYIPDLAKMLGYLPIPREQFKLSRRVNKALRIVWLYSRIWLDKLASSKIEIYTDYLKAPKEFKEDKELIKFLISNANREFNSHPQLNFNFLHTEKTTKFDEDFYAMLLQIIDSKYTSSILKAFSEVNLLGYYIHPFKKVEALAQFDGYHKFPVDIHLIKCIEALEHIEDKRLSNLYNALPKEKQRVLKVATLLHDTGKGRSSDHHVIGSNIFRAFAKKLGFSKEDIALGANLVLHHNKLSQFAQKEDIYSPKVIANFTAFFPTKIELDMIYLLTYADTSGVGANIYNTFNARLFATLYNNALEFLQHKEFLDEMSKRVHRVESLKRSKAFKVLPMRLQRKIISIDSNLPFIKYTTNRIIEISKRALEVDDYIYELSNSKFLTVEIIKKSNLDLGYLLAKLSFLNIANLDIVRLFDGKKYFKIDFQDTVDNAYLQEVASIVENAFLIQEPQKVISPNLDIEDILIDCNHSANYALMKLVTKDKKGLLAYVMTLFEELKIEIVSAKSQVIKTKAYDLFLIDKNGKFCKNVELIKGKLTQ